MSSRLGRRCRRREGRRRVERHAASPERAEVARDRRQSEDNAEMGNGEISPRRLSEHFPRLHLKRRRYDSVEAREVLLTKACTSLLAKDRQVADRPDLLERNRVDPRGLELAPHYLRDRARPHEAAQIARRHEWKVEVDIVAEIREAG